MPRASSWSYPKEHKLGFHGDDSPRWALVGPLVSENRVLRLVRPGLAGTRREAPAIAGGEPGAVAVKLGLTAKRCREIRRRDKRRTGGA